MRLNRQFALAAAFVLVAVTGCAASGSGDPDATSAAEEGALPVVPAEVGHVHGMAVNPADGLLYLGTHVGTLVLEGNAFTQVGESSVDLMGFASAGADHFYASGHPGPGDDLPNPVGLIESTDGGESWQSLSLGGESDFHTLGAAGDRVYGFNGQLVGTEDGKNWTPGAADVAPVSIAVDAAEPDRLVATTEQGPVRSEDGGVSFAQLEAAPLLVFVAWPSSEELWGVDVDGMVHLSVDGGESWQPRGAAGAPTAFAAGEGGKIVVATESQIVASDDGAKTFTPVAEVTGSGH